MDCVPSRSDRLREEQAFYDAYGETGSWLPSLRRLGRFPLAIMLGASVFGLLRLFAG
ncbi:MAG: hypothetical protein ABI612_19700 [Betaproteobacteria bacterium]